MPPNPPRPWRSAEWTEETITLLEDHATLTRRVIQRISEQMPEEPFLKHMRRLRHEAVRDNTTARDSNQRLREGLLARPP